MQKASLEEKKIGLAEAVSIGIGGMVGGGIFAVLGLATNLANGGTPIAFLFAGLIALLTSYSYVRLSLTYPDRGGTVRFINQGFGSGILSGGTNNLLWTSYIIMLSLYASAFGFYAPNLVQITGDAGIDFHLFASLVILVATAINYYSLKVVGNIEAWAVFVKLAILLLFVVLGLYGLPGSQHLEQLHIQYWASPLNLVVAGMIIFVAYEGFELIANAAPDIENPNKNIPRAYYVSVLFVMALYFVIAVITVGSLSFEVIASAQDYVLAEAAKPMLGQLGFTVITLAALVSTFSAINASLYGGSRVSYKIAEEGELPRELTYMLWNQPVGLFITASATLVLVNVLKLESIASAGSIGFLFVFAMVNLAAFRLAAFTKGNQAISLAGFVLCVCALVALMFHLYTTSLANLAVAVLVIGSCFGLEYVYKNRQRQGR